MSFIITLVLTPLLFRTWTLLAIFGIRLHHPVPVIEPVDQLLALQGDGPEIPVGGGGMIRIRLEESDDPEAFLRDDSWTERWSCSMRSPHVRIGFGLAHLALPVENPVLDVRVIWARPHPDDNPADERSALQSGVFLGSSGPWSTLFARPSMLRYSTLDFLELRRTRDVAFLADDSVQMMTGWQHDIFGANHIRIAMLWHEHNQLEATVYVGRYDGRDATDDDLRAVLARMVIGPPAMEIDR